MDEQKDLAKILMQIAVDLLDYEHDYESEDDLLEMTLNNIKHDFGESRYGDSQHYFKEET